ncbi:MAG TPA: hypothetical protein VGV68_00165 [Terriglobia bacterium]|nr:hypothetical protein [Terriglobia bacterium]
MRIEFRLAIILSAILLAASCGGGYANNNQPPAPVTLQLSASTLTATQDGSPATVNVTLVRPYGNTNSITLSVTGLPTGVTKVITSPGTGNTGMISFDAQGAAAGAYSVTVNATDGVTNATAALTLVVAIVTTVQNTVNTNAGVNGRLQEFMATSFQPAEWDYQFFINHPDITPLTNLGPRHIRIQGISQAVPMRANSSPQQPTDWNFTMLDDVVQPILAAADHSPEFQIAVAPSFMNDASGHLDITNHLNDFVQYCANLVRYYNTGGFTWGGTLFKSASMNKITWWGIFNEYNINGLTPAQYVQVYNAVVPAMLAVDPTIKFSALELADFDSGSGDPRVNLPTFVDPSNQGGVNAQVNIVSTHFYSSCNQSNPDTQLFNSVAGFASDVTYFYQELKLRPDLANVPVWVTENNVNADFDKGGGISACNGTAFVLDRRGTSAFFSAWRPYVFSQLGKAGNQALYHWDYDADQQYGEVDFNSANKYLSYWVDYYLARYFPSPPGSNILTVDTTETTTVEILVTRNDDGSVVVMVANHAVHSSSDNNGTGDPRTVVVDVSLLGAFSSATQLTIDANTDPANGPTSVAVTVTPRMTVTLNGYGVSFLEFKP